MTTDTMTSEAIVARTALTISKWDADATEWVLRREMSDEADGWLRRRENATVRPEAFNRHLIEPYETWHMENCNNVLQAGWVALLGGIAGTTMTNKFSASFGRIGAGTSNTAVAYTQTALVGDTGGGSTTSYYMLVSTAPVIATGSTPPTLTLTAAFGTAVGNFAWNEFGTDNYTASGVTTTGLGASVIFFNRGVPAGGMGTKSSGQTWTATESISFGFPSGSGTVS
jgi:hypothetical protein